jgi:2-hydroxychromene-2-carboxylate isomerase
VPYPVHTEHAARAFQWLSDRNPDEARSFAHAVFRAYFVEGRNIAETGRAAGDRRSAQA